MGLEFSKALLRLAIKKGEELTLRKENAALGSVLGMINAVTEKADTRNWQTLPYSIYYSRIPLKEGENNLTFSLKGVDGKIVDHKFTYQVKKGQTLFHTFSSLECQAQGYPNY
jgi:hypothetical protein